MSPTQARRGGRVTVAVRRERCVGCGGAGYGSGHGGGEVGLCMLCSGTGMVSSNRAIRMDLPTGLTDGAQVRVGREGSLGWYGRREHLVYVVHVDRAWDRVDPKRTEQT